MTASEKRLPLEGTRVVEVGQIVAGPTAGLILADMGADVIKVEPPDAGTPRRPGNLRTGSFFFFNRNKRSLVVDLAAPEGTRWPGGWSVAPTCSSRIWLRARWSG